MATGTVAGDGDVAQNAVSWLTSRHESEIGRTGGTPADYLNGLWTRLYIQVPTRERFGCPPTPQISRKISLCATGRTPCAPERGRLLWRLCPFELRHRESSSASTSGAGCESRLKSSTKSSSKKMGSRWAGTTRLDSRSTWGSSSYLQTGRSPGYGCPAF